MEATPPAAQEASPAPQNVPKRHRVDPEQKLKGFCSELLENNWNLSSVFFWK
jgi:hypothetical protein